MTHPCVRKPRRRTPVQPPGRGLRSASISTGHSACLPLRAHPLHLRSAPSPVRGLTALPPVTLAAKSAPRRIRRCLPAARGAARRLFRSRRRDALGGRRLRRLCAAASHSRLAVPTSSPSASHAGGVPSWARREWRRRRIRDTPPKTDRVRIRKFGSRIPVANSHHSQIPLTGRKFGSDSRLNLLDNPASRGIESFPSFC